MSRRKHVMVAAMIVALAATTGCSIVQQGWYYYATERGRVGRYQQGAYEAEEEGDLARAEKKIAKARKLRPASALLASGQAWIVAKAGRAEEALAILEEAERLGWDWVHGLDEPRWDPVRDTARFAALKSSLKARGEEKRRAWFDVEVPDPLTSPSFDTLAALELAFDRERK